MKKMSVYVFLAGVAAVLFFDLLYGGSGSPSSDPTTVTLLTLSEKLDSLQDQMTQLSKKQEEAKTAQEGLTKAVTALNPDGSERLTLESGCAVNSYFHPSEVPPERPWEGLLQCDHPPKFRPYPFFKIRPQEKPGGGKK